MKTKINITNHISISVFLLTCTVLLLSCGGCRIGKVNTTLSEITTDATKTGTEPESPPATHIKEDNATPYVKPEVHIQRQYLGKDIDLALNPEHRGGEGWSPIWEEEFQSNDGIRMNRIVQLSPTVLLYRRFPKEAAKSFYYIDQPEKIEFLDSAYNTIKVVDIWKNRPYQDVKNAKLTYWNFDSEGMGVIPYSEQEHAITPNEYSLFTDVRSEGNHVIVNYELRSIKNSKQWGMEASDVVAVKHTLYIYDLQGNLKYVLKDLPSIDGAVVSDDGKYMMYIFGGMGLANANSPFGMIERPGWALMRLEDQKVVYQEYTDDGILAFNRLSIQQNMLVVGYSTPKTNDGVYDYFVFFDEKNESIYKKLWTHEEWKLLDYEWNKTDNKLWSYYIKKFNFEQIEVSEK